MAVEAYFGSARSSGTTWAARHGRLHLPRPLSAFADRLLLPVIACFVWRKYTIRRGNCQVKRTARCVALSGCRKSLSLRASPQIGVAICPQIAQFLRFSANLQLKDYGFTRRFAPRSKYPWGAPRNDRIGLSTSRKGGAMRRPLSLLCSYRLLDLIQMPCFWALAMSSSRNMGWAMEMSFSARSQVEQPTRFTPPYSVTM